MRSFFVTAGPEFAAEPLALLYLIACHILPENHDANLLLQLLAESPTMDMKCDWPFLCLR